MQKPQFTLSQIAAILKREDAGLPVGDVIRKYGMSSASYYKSKTKLYEQDSSKLRQIKKMKKG